MTARLIPIHTGDVDRTVSTEGAVLGRGHDCAIRIVHESVSRHHARIDHTPEGWQIADLQSRNGTFVNHIPVFDVVPLRDGDMVEIGDFQFTFRLPEPEDDLSQIKTRKVSAKDRRAKKR